MDRKILYLIEICILLLICSLFFILASPTQGYESSIYLSTPIFVWISLFFCIMCSVSIIIYQIYFDKYDKFTVTLCFGLILWSNFIILSLFLLRGYYFWDASGDPGFHIGWIKDLLDTGRINNQNFYPITHIFISQLSLISNIDYISASLWLIVFFEMLSFVFIYLFSTVIFDNRDEIILSTIIGMILLLGWYIDVTPQEFSVLFFPLVLYLIFKQFKNYRLGFSILTVIIILFYTTLHILSSFFVSLIIFLLIVFNFFYLNKKLDEKVYYSYFLILIFSIIVSFAWFDNFNFFYGNIGNTFNLLQNGFIQNQINTMAQTAGSAEQAGYNIWEYAIKTKTGSVILEILAWIGIVCLWIKHKNTREFQKLKLLSFFILISFGIYLIFNFIKFSFSLGRILTFFYFVQIIFDAYLISELLNWGKRASNSLRYVIPIFILFLLSVIFLNGILLVYPSSYSYDISLQNTHAEISGASWFFYQKDPNFYITSWYFDTRQYAMFIMHKNERETRNDLFPINTNAFPDHLGYTKNIAFGDQFSQDFYLLISKKIEIIYSEIRPEMARFRLTKQDLHRLDIDYTLHKVYDNGFIEIYPGQYKK